MKRRSLKTRLTVLVGVAALISIAALTAGFNLLLRSNLDGDADRVLQARAAAALEGVEIQGERVVVNDAPDEAAPESGVWIYQGDRAIESPSAPATVQALADSIARRGGGSAESKDEDLRLYGVPISNGPEPRGTVVVALSVEPYERSANNALIASLGFAALVLALIIGLIRIVVARALRPVAEMTAEAADWSEHDLDHRFNLGPPQDELTHLATTFDSMLARLAANLRHEQRLTAEVSHELRTPLAAITAEAELALKRSREGTEYRAALEAIERRAAQLTEILETLLLASRSDGSAGGESADANAVAERAIALFAQGPAADSISVELQASPATVRVDGGIATVTRILSPLIENAARYGNGSVGVEVAVRGQRVEYTISDDGPGIAPGERERIFEPGSRGAAAEGRPQGSGLGLALARRLARALGGDVEIAEGEPGGAGGAVRAYLPLAASG